MQPGSPLIACLYNRLAYVIENKVDLTTRSLIILPYLHERKVHLNWRTSTDQFYTISQYKGTNFILCMQFNENKMLVYLENGVLADVYDFEA
jgi:hypothetical protein